MIARFKRYTSYSLIFVLQLVFLFSSTAVVAEGVPGENNGQDSSVASDADGYPDSWNEGMTQVDSTTGLVLDAFPNDATERADTDGDGVGTSEPFPDNSNYSMDADHDNIPDEWEEVVGLSTSTDNSATDSDGDGVLDGDEFIFGTHPLQLDSDSDGLSDGAEVANGTDPLVDNTTMTDIDGDDIPDSYEIAVGLDETEVNGPSQDSDGDGYNDRFEYLYGLDPLIDNSADADSDGDGILDSIETVTGTDPSVADGSDDPDGDGITNLEEIANGTLPTVDNADDAVDVFSLEGLMGVPEIEVRADSEGEISVLMAEYQALEEDPSQQIDEANLVDSIAAGRGFSRESLAAVARIEQAKAQANQSLGDYLPSAYIAANRGIEISEPSVVVDESTGELKDHSRHIRTDIVFTAKQQLFNLPVILDVLRRKARERSSEESFRVSDGDAYISTANTYLSLVSSRLQADVTLDFEAQLADLLSYIEKRAGAGAASVSDMSRVRAQSQATSSNRLEKEAAHAAAGTEFVRLTNLVPKRVTLPRLNDIGADFMPETLGLAVDKAMKDNPEIAALTAELEAVRFDQGASSSTFLPRLEAEYTDTFSMHAGGGDERQRDKRLMLVMNWNFMNGGKDINAYREKYARQKELRYHLNNERRRVVQSLSSNYAILKITRLRLAAGYDELASRSTATEAMSKRMLSGNQSLLDLLTVYEGYYQVRSRLIDLHVQEMKTVAQIIRLTQGAPWVPPQMKDFEGKHEGLRGIRDF